MVQAHPRAKFGKWAGRCYTASNVAMLFKSSINSMLETGAFDLSLFNLNATDIAVGTIALIASSLLAVKGDDNKWAGVSNGLATFRKSLFAHKMFQTGHHPSSVIGMIVSAGFSAHGCYQAYKRHKRANHENSTDVNQPKDPALKKNFIQTAGDVLNKYPNGLAGVSNVGTYFVLTYSAMNVKDPTLIGIGIVSTIGSRVLCTFATKS